MPKRSKAAEAYLKLAREKMQNINLTRDISATAPDEYPFFLELVSRHPKANEKLADFKTIGIRKYKDYGQLELFIVRDNQPDLDISCVDCCTGKGKKDTTYFVNSARSSIQYQINDIRLTLEQKCQLCNSIENLQVDHILEFNKILDMFKKSEPIQYKFDFKLEGGHSFLDKDYEKRWQEFHKKHANFRILCQKCNNAEHEKNKLGKK